MIPTSVWRTRFALACTVVLSATVSSCGSNATQSRADVELEEAELGSTDHAVKEDARARLGIAKVRVKGFTHGKAIIDALDEAGRVVVELAVKNAAVSGAADAVSYELISGDPDVLQKLEKEAAAADPQFESHLNNQEYPPGGVFFVLIGPLIKTIIAIVVPPTVEKLEPSFVNGFDFGASMERSDGIGNPRSADDLRKTLMCEALMAEQSYENPSDVCGLRREPSAGNEFAQVWSADRAQSLVLVLSVRGTAGGADALIDARSATHEIQVNAGSMGFPRTALDAKATVGYGWTQRWRQIADGYRVLFESYRARAEKEKKIFEVVVVGHSLGGATAQLGAIALHEELRSGVTAPRFHVRATTFNSPTVGSRDLRALIQQRLVESCPTEPRAGASCLSVHLFERMSDLVHDVPVDDVHPVWQTNNSDSTMGSGPRSSQVGKDKTMYWGDSFLISLATTTPTMFASHSLVYWRHDAKIMSDDILRSMKDL
jgi:hypothetical protein